MILVDTREQYPFQFEAYGIATKVCKLDTADYTFEGYQDKICIERKRSVSELAHNIGKDWKRFSAELERMKVFPHKYIICEFPTEDILNYPNVNCMPKKVRKYIRITPQFIIKRIEQIENDYNIIFFFCNSTEHAEQTVIELYRELCQNNLEVM